jgi:hypothetical protein
MAGPVLIKLTRPNGKHVRVNMNRVLFVDEDEDTGGSRLTMNIPATHIIVREEPKEVDDRSLEQSKEQ